MTTLPSLTLPDQEGKSLHLANLTGCWTILYFYPQDDTPGCTVEAGDFTAMIPEFETLDARVIGISPDSCASHRKFIDKHALKLTLLADENKEAINHFGVWGIKKNYGKEYEGLIRSTFLIDPNGAVVHEWRNVRAKGHAQRVLEKLREIIAAEC
ncbi:MAG: peroxiredoxin [Chlamydiales bacterium]|nr:peroxiredoxin [Chlamydiia bacterium]MCP5506844.1 peroxiredoxin [Chlamydiales bacterium]